MTVLRELVTKLRYSFTSRDRRVRADYDKGLDRTRAANKKLAASNAALGSSFAGVGRSLAGLGAIFGTAFTGKAIIDAGDDLDTLENRIRAIEGADAPIRAIRRELAELANENYSNLDDTANIFQRFRIGTEDLGKSRDDILDFTDLVQKSAATAGATAQETNNALIQFAQGIASNRLGGEEFRSVSEQLPTLLRVLKRELGVSTGEIRKRAFAGELTAEVIFTAFNNQRDFINENFKDLQLTRSLALQQFKTGFTTFFGAFSQGAKINDDLATLLAAVGGFFRNNEKLARKLGMAYQDIFVAIFDGVGALFGATGAGGLFMGVITQVGNGLEQLRSFLRSYAQLRENGFGKGEALELSAAGIFGEDAARAIKNIAKALGPVVKALAFIFGARLLRSAARMVLTFGKFLFSLRYLAAAVIAIQIAFKAWNKENSALQRLWKRLQDIWNGNGNGEGLGAALTKLGKVIAPAIGFAFEALAVAINVVAEILIAIVDTITAAYNIGKKIIGLADGKGRRQAGIAAQRVKVERTHQENMLAARRALPLNDFKPIASSANNSRVKYTPEQDAMRQQIRALGATLSAYDPVTTVAPRNTEIGPNGGRVNYGPAQVTNAVTVNLPTAEMAARFTDALQSSGNVFQALRMAGATGNLTAATPNY